MKNTLLILIAGVVSPIAAHAVVIDFNALATTPPGHFTSLDEDGIHVEATNGRAWSGVWGFPTTSVGTQALDQTATFVFTSGALFNFDGFDLVDPGNGGVGPVTVVGYLESDLVAMDSFILPAIKDTPTSYFASALAGLTVDRLEISLTSSPPGTTGTGGNTPLLDNVSLTPVAGVPEPISLLLLGAGLMALAYVRRRFSLQCKAGRSCRSRRPVSRMSLRNDLSL